MDASPRSIYLNNCCVNHNPNIQARDTSNRNDDEAEVDDEYISCEPILPFDTTMGVASLARTQRLCSKSGLAAGRRNTPT